MKWIDKKRAGEIKSSEIRFGEFKLTVHHYMGCGDIWFASFAYIFNKVELASKDLDEAKCQAVAKCQVILQEALDLLLQDIPKIDPTGYIE